MFIDSPNSSRKSNGPVNCPVNGPAVTSPDQSHRVNGPRAAYYIGPHGPLPYRCDSDGPDRRRMNQ